MNTGKLGPLNLGEKLLHDNPNKKKGRRFPTALLKYIMVQIEINPSML